jgi:hypothetical protein
VYGVAQPMVLAAPVTEERLARLHELRLEDRSLQHRSGCKGTDGSRRQLRDARLGGEADIRAKVQSAWSSRRHGKRTTRAR